MFVGDAEKLLSDVPRQAKRSTTHTAAFTHFPLNRETVRQPSGEDYLSWLERLAPLYASYLAPGSIVMEIGNVWEPGRPTMNLTAPALIGLRTEPGCIYAKNSFAIDPARLLPSNGSRSNDRVKGPIYKSCRMSPIDFESAT